MSTRITRKERKLQKQQLLKRCGGKMEAYKKEKEKSNFTIMNNIKDSDDNTEEREDAMIKAAQNNANVCKKWLESIQTELEKKKDDNHDDDAEIDVVDALECVDAANYYLSHQIAACEKACDPELYEKQLKDTALEIDAKILNLTICVFKEWIGVPGRYLESILKFIKYYKDDPVAAEKDLPHFSDVKCVSSSGSGAKEGFAQNQEYSLCAIILDKLQQEGFNNIKLFAMYWRLQAECQGRFIHMMKGTLSVLSVIKMRMLDCDLKDVEKTAEARMEYLEEEMEDSLGDIIYLLDAMFAAEGAKEFNQEQISKLHAGICEYYKVEIKKEVTKSLKK
eukprot:425747_1